VRKYIWIDVGCDDLQRAARNREIITQKLYVWAYVQVENWLAANPKGYIPDSVYTEGFVYDPVQSGRKGGLATVAKMTPEERSELARKGGLASAAKKTPQERSESAKNAVNARIIKYNQKRLSH